VLPEPNAFADEWITAWNSHDLEAILSHYTDDVTVTSPMIRVAIGGASATLQGKARVGEYWAAALAKVSDLHFELLHATVGEDSIALVYRAVLGKIAVEVMRFSPDARVSEVTVHYG